MLKEKETFVKRLMIAADAFVVIFSFFLAYFLRQHFRSFYKLDLIPSAQVVGGQPKPLNL